MILDMAVGPHLSQPPNISFWLFVVRSASSSLVVWTLWSLSAVSTKSLPLIELGLNVCRKLERWEHLNTNRTGQRPDGDSPPFMRPGRDSRRRRNWSVEKSVTWKVSRGRCGISPQKFIKISNKKKQDTCCLFSLVYFKICPWIAVQMDIFVNLFWSLQLVHFMS
jgi:hypothetical protein